MDTLKTLLAAPLVIAYALASPITYILLVVDTWHGRSSAFVKILISLTLDAILAGIWPFTWAMWIVMHLAGHATPLRTVLGI